MGDVAFLLTTDPEAIKKWIKKGTRYGVPFCPPRWVTTTDQRLWAFADLEAWARQHDFALRPIEELESRVERRRRALGWHLVEAGR